MSKIDDLIENVEQWAEDRLILMHSKPMPQLMKTMSELGELADATLKNDREEIIDGIGDVLVTLIIYSALQFVPLETALQAAYDQIKDRKGYLTPEGIFIKQQ
jgi:hypothetical protein